MTTRVLELFSGIGGMRCGLLNTCTGPPTFEFTAIDMNEFCNQVYFESFGDKPISADILSLSVEWFENLAAEFWTMSPPCQPYSRQGNQLGKLDDRAKPLHHLIAVLGVLVKLPRVIIVENVKGFEVSDSFEELTTVLATRGYGLRGFLMNPLYLGFPNSRLRFFLIAVLGGSGDNSIVTNDPACAEYASVGLPVPQRMIEEFLCTDHAHHGGLKLSNTILSKQAAFCFDVVSPQSRQCLCFTRAYTKFINGTGSVLFEGLPGGSGVPAEVVIETDEMDRPKFNLTSMTELEGQLRYFCPLEVARLSGFDTSQQLRLQEGCAGGKKYYRALGNSLNPQVVAHILDLANVRVSIS